MTAGESTGDPDDDLDDRFDDEEEDDSGYQRDGPSADTRKKLVALGLMKPVKSRASRAATTRAKKTKTTTKKKVKRDKKKVKRDKKKSQKKTSKRQSRSSGPKTPRPTTATERKEAIGRPGYKKRHIRFPFEIDEELMTMREEDETTITDVVLTAVHNEFVRRLRRRTRQERKAKSEAASEGDGKTGN